MSGKLDQADFWLKHGFSLLPCQPNSKALVSSFGQYRSKITDMAQAAQFWGHGGACNMAVFAPEGFYILDFDKISVYAQWAGKCSEAAQGYTETTPRGGKHVFCVGEVPSGLTLIEGAEVKRVVLVAPSSIDGKPYQITHAGDFASLDAAQVFTPISKPGHATPYAIQADAIRQRAAAVNPLSRIEKIKSHFLISVVLQTYNPGIILNGAGDFKSCKCPFHKDNRPSFWFNDLSGLWGCHACNVRGDVINLYARLEAINVREAITRMWSVMA